MDESSNRKGKDLSYEERIELAAYLRAGMRMQWIADTMGRSRATIYNEMRRGRTDDGGYSIDAAQADYEANNANRGRKKKPHSG